MATRQGQFMIFSTGKPKEQFDIIDQEDYKLRVTKTWVEATAVWHIKIQSQSVFDYSFECFLTHEQLAKLKDVL